MKQYLIYSVNGFFYWDGGSAACGAGMSSSFAMRTTYIKVPNVGRFPQAENGANTSVYQQGDNQWKKATHPNLTRSGISYCGGVLFLSVGTLIHSATYCLHLKDFSDLLKMRKSRLMLIFQTAVYGLA